MSANGCPGASAAAGAGDPDEEGGGGEEEVVTVEETMPSVPLTGDAATEVPAETGAPSSTGIPFEELQPMFFFRYLK